MTYIAVIKNKDLNHNCFVAIIITNIKHSSLTKHFRRFRTIDIIYMLFSFYLNLCCSFRKNPGSSSGSSKIEKVREKSNQISHSVSLGITRAINKFHPLYCRRRRRCCLHRRKRRSQLRGNSSVNFSEHAVSLRPLSIGISEEILSPLPFPGRYHLIFRERRERREKNVDA